jgi:hypothetical protein
MGHSLPLNGVERPRAFTAAKLRTRVSPKARHKKPPILSHASPICKFCGSAVELEHLRLQYKYKISQSPTNSLFVNTTLQSPLLPLPLHNPADNKTSQASPNESSRQAESSKRARNIFLVFLDCGIQRWGGGYDHAQG